MSGTFEGDRKLCYPAIGLVLALMMCVAGPALAASLKSAPPEKGGKTESLGMPPVYKGFVGAELQWYYPGATSTLAGLGSLGLRRDLGSPIVGIAALGIDGYAGVRSAKLDGGVRAYFGIPSFHLGLGIDYNIRDDKGSFLLGLHLPIRRGGLFGRASTLDLRWQPGFGNTFSVGVGVPLWGSNLGKTRPKHDSVKLATRKPTRLDASQAHDDLDYPLSVVRERALWISRLTQPFAEEPGGDPHEAMAPVLASLQAHMDSTDGLFPQGHLVNEEIRVYHEYLDHVFSLALGEATLAPGSSTAIGRDACAVARRILMDEVLLAYNYLLGQRKTNDNLSAMVAVAQTEFARWLLSHADINHEQSIDAFYVFQTLCDIVEELREELRDRWEDSRFVWLPLQCGLKPEEHDTQAELDDIIERATRHDFTVGNKIWYVINEQFQWEIARSIHRAEDYHVLWIHDIRGKNGAGKPDEMAYRQVTNYLRAMTTRVRAYDDAGKLPIYMIFLDQHYFEINKSRLWLRLLSDPLNYEIGLPGGYEAWEEHLAELQQQLREAVESSSLLRMERSQYGDDWLKNRIKVQVNITNPADPSFWSWHIAGIIPMPDNNMRDHRKIAFYDITEADPYRGMAMFTGMGIGEHYAGANWEDRAIMVTGPEALTVKDAARELLEHQGFSAEEMPYPLRKLPRAADYDQRVAAEIATLPDWLDDELRVMQLHSETGFYDKPINPAKAVLYSLMPSGSVLTIPDSLWQSYIYASLMAGSALRGCRVLIIAPTAETAPSAGTPTLARAYGLLSRVIVFNNGMDQRISDAGGLYELGLYAPQHGVGDIAGRMQQSMENYPKWSDRVYGFHPDVNSDTLAIPALLDSLGYTVHYLAEADSLARPKMHLKANFFASALAWDKLIARPEWVGVFREYVTYLAEQSTPESGESVALPDVQAIPKELSLQVRLLVRNAIADLRPDELDQLIYYFSVGSVNMDYRSMCLDGEVMILLGGWQSLQGVLDFLLLAGLCEWLETTEELDALLKPPSGFWRSTSGLIKLML